MRAQQIGAKVPGITMRVPGGSLDAQHYVANTLESGGRVIRAILPQLKRDWSGLSYTNSELKAVSQVGDILADWPARIQDVSRRYYAPEGIAGLDQNIGDIGVVLGPIYAAFAAAFNDPDDRNARNMQSLRMLHELTYAFDGLTGTERYTDEEIARHLLGVATAIKNDPGAGVRWPNDPYVEEAVSREKKIFNDRIAGAIAGAVLGVHADAYGRAGFHKKQRQIQRAEAKVEREFLQQRRPIPRLRETLLTDTLIWSLHGLASMGETRGARWLAEMVEKAPGSLLMNAVSGAMSVLPVWGKGDEHTMAAVPLLLEALHKLVQERGRTYGAGSPLLREECGRQALSLHLTVMRAMGGDPSKFLKHLGGEQADEVKRRAEAIFPLLTDPQRKIFDRILRDEDVFDTHPA